jgi:glycine betaine/proline transport system substrate-binding protein
MWGRFDLRYLDGAQTGQTDVFGEPENIRKLAHPSFRDEMPAEVVSLLQNVHLEETAMANLMNRFRPGQGNYLDTAREWIRDHPALVREWLR